MANSPLIRPAIYWGKRGFGGVPLDCHEQTSSDDSMGIFNRRSYQVTLPVGVLVMCQGQGCRVLLGMGKIPPLIGIIIIFI